MLGVRGRWGTAALVLVELLPWLEATLNQCKRWKSAEISSQLVRKLHKPMIPRYTTIYHIPINQSSFWGLSRFAGVQECRKGIPYQQRCNFHKRSQKGKTHQLSGPSWIFMNHQPKFTSHKIVNTSHNISVSFQGGKWWKPFQGISRHLIRIWIPFWTGRKGFLSQNPHCSWGKHCQAFPAASPQGESWTCWTCWTCEEDPRTCITCEWFSVIQCDVEVTRCSLFILFPFRSIGAKVQCVGFASVASALHRSFAPDAKPGYADRFRQGLQCGTSCDLSTLVKHIGNPILNMSEPCFLNIHLPSFAHHYFLRDASSSSSYDRCRDSAGSWIKAIKGKQDNLWEIWLWVLCHKVSWRTSRIQYDHIWSTDMWFEGVIVHESIGNSTLFRRQDLEAAGRQEIFENSEFEVASDLQRHSCTFTACGLSFSRPDSLRMPCHRMKIARSIGLPNWKAWHSSVEYKGKGSCIWNRSSWNVFSELWTDPW